MSILHWVTDDNSRRRLRSATTHQLMVRRRWKCWTWKWRTWNWRTNLQDMKLTQKRQTF